MRPIAEALAADLHPDDDIFVYLDAGPAFRYYFRDDLPDFVLPAKNYAAHEQALQNLLDEPGTVWMVFSHCGFLEDDEGRPNICERLVMVAQGQREVEQVISAHDAWLYRVVPQ